MKELRIFKNNKFGEIRVTVTENNDPMFCLSDVCNALGIVNHRDAKARLNPKGVGTADTLTKGGIQPMTYIDEGNLYKLTLQSRKQEAEEFQDWLCYEVAPSIRKHGAYLTAKTIEKALTDPDTIIQLATTLKEERRQKEILRQQTELQGRVIERNAPKVEYFDEVLQSESTYNTTQIAKELGMGAPTLNRKLKEMRVQYLQNGTWVLYEKYQNKGFTKTKTHFYVDNGVQKTSMLTVWTERGRLFIHSLFNNNTKGKIKEDRLRNELLN